MIKIRITGLPDEVECFLKKLREHFFILNETKPCKNSNSKFVRKYVDLQEDNKNE